MTATKEITHEILPCMDQIIYFLTLCRIKLYICKKKGHLNFM